MDDMILLDGVKYLRYSPQSEDEFERLVVENAAQIFGEDAIYLDIKKKIANALGEGTIPDGFLFYPEQKRFVMVEVELSSHPVYEHISKQVNKFISAFSNYKSRQKLASMLKEYIEDDPALLKRMQPLLGAKALYEFLEFEVFEPLADSKAFEVLVIIENETQAVDESLSWLNPCPKIIEVAVYAREGAEIVKALRFVRQFVAPKKANYPIIETKKTNRETLQTSNELEFPIPVYADYKGKHFEGKLFSDGSIEVNGVRHESPSGAGRAVRGGGQINGWDFWKLSNENDVSIQSIRERVKKQQDYNLFVAEKRQDGYSFAEIGQLWKEFKSRPSDSRGKIDMQTFLESIDDSAKTLFSRILQDTEVKGYRINWGVKGFSVNKKIGNENISLFECYPPNTPWGQSILVSSHETMARKVVDYEKIREECKSRLMELGFFKLSGKKSVSWLIDKSTSINKLSDFWRIIDDFAAKARLN